VLRFRDGKRLDQPDDPPAAAAQQLGLIPAPATTGWTTRHRRRGRQLGPG